MPLDPEIAAYLEAQKHLPPRASLDIAAKRPRIAGRAEAASPATGLFKRHAEEQTHLVAEALAP